ncbi:MAG: hypothetical protein ACE14M_07730 [Terriglobales bacterium]
MLFFIPVFFSLKANVVGDPDVWWHLRTGQWIVEHRTIPSTDPFSVFGAGKPWVPYSWLFEVALYGFYRGFGLMGILYVQLAACFAITLALLALARRVDMTPWKSFALTSSALLAMIPMLAPRPWLLTILFLTMELHILLKAREGSDVRGLWLLPFIFAVWANIHVQFVYGLLVLGLAAMEPAVTRLFPLAGSASPSSAPPRRMWLVLAACMLATLVSPYTVKIYKVIFDLGAQSRDLALVTEFHAPQFRNIADYLVLTLAMAGVFALAWRRNLMPFNMLLLAVSAAVSFRMARDVWLVIIVAVGIISSYTEPTKRSSYRTSRGQWAAIAATVVVLAAITVWSRHLSERELQAVVESNYPVNAAKYVADHKLNGPLYNDFDWGGYLIWALPELPVSMDGRTNVHGDERILRSYRTWTASSAVADDKELLAAKVVIANLRLPLSRVLRSDPGFQLVYQDKVAAVFVATNVK